MNSFGVELCEATLGNRSLNLRRAIACYEAALRVYTESDFPADWAGTQNNLGIAYSNLPAGDRGENLRLAIDCYARRCGSTPSRTTRPTGPSPVDRRKKGTKDTATVALIADRLAPAESRHGRRGDLSV